MTNKETEERLDLMDDYFDQMEDYYECMHDYSEDNPQDYGDKEN